MSFCSAYLISVMIAMLWFICLWVHLTNELHLDFSLDSMACLPAAFPRGVGQSFALANLEERDGSLYQQTISSSYLRGRLSKYRTELPDSEFGIIDESAGGAPH